MADTGFVLCGTGTSEGGGNGVAAWATPENITADDGNLAERSSIGAGDWSEYLHGENYGLSVPTGASIDGIEIRVNGWSSSTNREVRAREIRLVKAGTRVGNNLTDLVDWPLADTTLNIYGGATELGGVTWTPAEVNAADFGAAIQVERASIATLNATARIDAVWIKVYYTEGGGGGSTGNRLIMW